MCNLFQIDCKQQNIGNAPTMESLESLQQLLLLLAWWMMRWKVAIKYFTMERSRTQERKKERGRRKQKSSMEDNINIVALQLRVLLCAPWSQLDLLWPTREFRQPDPFCKAWREADKGIQAEWRSVGCQTTVHFSSWKVNNHEDK